jgi:hypothetical protein
MALLSFVESAPRAYWLKAGNAASPISTSSGTIPRGDRRMLPYAIAYLHNVYGPRERAGKYGTVIEIFRQKFLRSELLTVTLPGTQRRRFTHVCDTVVGLILIGEKGQGDNFALGTETSHSILELNWRHPTGQSR